MRFIFRTLEGAVFDLGIEQGNWAEPADESPLDVSRLWAIPGLADAHAHLSQDELTLGRGVEAEIRERAFACLERGVFLCLDKGWSDNTVLKLADRPPTERPDLEAAGEMIAAPGGYFPDFCREVTDDELAGAVRRAAAAGGGWVKLIGDWPRRGAGPQPNFSGEALRGAVKVAHAAGARVAIHTMAPDVPHMAVEAGVDSIEHGLFLSDDDVRSLGSRGGAWVPTVVRMEAVRSQLGADSSGGRLISEGLDRVRDLLPVALESGVAVLSGSDLAVPPGHIAAEAVRLTSYGMSSHQAIESVSGAARAYVGLHRSFQIGEPADLVAFDRHPSEDITVLSEPVIVLRYGRLLRDLR